MLGGYNNYGYGGRQGGGQEMMLIVLCCICCVCVVSILAGYWFNLFCGVSTSLGKSCPPKETDPPLAPETGDPVPSPPTALVDPCTAAFASERRTGSDPRPPLRAQSCMNSPTAAAGVRGRDCHMWTVVADPVTQQARWMRVPEVEGVRDKYDATCTRKEVDCPAYLNPLELQAYTDINPRDLINKCRAVAPTATTKNDTIRQVTAAANRIGNFSGAKRWTDANSEIWYSQVARFIVQKNLTTYINNVEIAANAVKNKLKITTMSKAAIAAMLEANVKGGATNEPEWIINVTNTWVGTLLLKPQDRTVGAYIQFLEPNVRGRKFSDWPRLIENTRKY